jgi:CheY-like chemotaxis protein
LFTIPYKNHISKSISEIKISPEIYNNTDRQKTVLIVEDEEMNYLLLERFLSNINFIILHARHGQEAIEYCIKNPYIDIVLMDLKIPGIDGFEATKQIKEFRPELPVIAQSAYTSDNDIEKAMVCGCSDFITKPFTRALILTKIDEYLIKDC